jgi:hypothetical protein
MMNITISIPSRVEAGQNLPVRFHVSQDHLDAPTVECGFEAKNEGVALRRESGGWGGEMNLHVRLAGTTFLRLRLTNPAHPAKCWEGSVPAHFSAQHQPVPVNITGSSNQGEKSGLGQALSQHFNIQVGGRDDGASFASGPVLWQHIPVELHDCGIIASAAITPGSAPFSQVSASHPPTPPPAAATPLPQTDLPHNPGSTLGTLARGNAMALGFIAVFCVLTLAYLVIGKGHKENPDQDKGAEVTKPEPPPPAPDPPIEVRELSATYQSGEHLKLQVRLAKPGYLRLLTCDPAGTIVQLYPCKLDAVKVLPSDSWIALPDPEIASTTPGFGYECYLPDGRNRETTRVLVQWSPHPFELTGMRGLGEFYQPQVPVTLEEIATRGVRVSLGTPAVESKNLTFEVVTP